MPLCRRLQREARTSSLTARPPARPPVRPTALLAVLALLLPAASNGQDPAFSDELFQAMQWRNIGPFRGGRSVAVAGVPSDPLTYYFGSTGGGVWKTTDAGVTWTNVSDGFLHTGSVGAIAVADSDPNVVYVGMGEHAVRGVATSHGDGVYKSTDAGRTWRHMGLSASRAISRIRIHPANPDLVYVAVQGAPYGETEERGIYRSRDGGASWDRILYVSPRAGASDLAMDMTNPRILYAAFWDHLRRPWVVESGGDGSGIWKSTDGGDTWDRLGNGLPDLMGKIGVDVSRADPDRVYAIVEADPAVGGLYRSDDAGASWSKVNGDRVIQARSWYYMEVYADPVDENTVYVMNAPFLESIDAGRTFTQVGVPHGDEHDLWINPHDNRIMINANDGGANVSMNGGRTWSTQRNQPTVQFYRVNVDNQFPYHVYGGQQDNTSVGLANAALGGIGWKDWYTSAGCESAYLAFDPDDPREVLGTCIVGGIDVWNRETRQVKSVQAYPYLGLGTRPVNQKYRFDWNAPIIVSPHDPNVFYHAGNVLLRTEDRGQSWTEISPDLTRDEEDRQGLGGVPITNEAAGGEVYNVIMYVTESPHEAGTIWVGTNDGLVHVTRNGGQSWDNVTPDGIGRGTVNAIEVSPHDPAAAYIAVAQYKFNDFTPHIFKTTDYGESWRRIVDGIAAEAWVRVVREDPVRRGLLYAGTELGMYISFDDGRQWQPWQLNLPTVPITDLVIHRNDLVAATQGRGFWILDDLSPVQQMTREIAGAPLHLFEPRDAVLVRWSQPGPGGPPPNTGANPPDGAQLFYTVREVTDAPLRVEIVQNGEVLRTYASDSSAAARHHWTKIDGPKAGLNRFAWDFRHQAPPAVEGIFVPGGVTGRTAAPGTYEVRLNLGDQSATRELRLVPDPRWRATAAQYVAQEQFLRAAVASLDEMHRGANLLRGARDQVQEIIQRTADRAEADTIEAAGGALADAITEWEGELVQPKRKTYQDFVNFENQLTDELLYLISAVDGTEPPVTAGALERLGDLQEEWTGLRATMLQLVDDLEGFNTLLERLGVGPVIFEGPEAPRAVSRRE